MRPLLEITLIQHGQFGRYGHIGGKPTPLNYKDEARFDQSVELVRRIGAGEVSVDPTAGFVNRFLGHSELWPDELPARLVARTAPLFHPVFSDQKVRDLRQATPLVEGGLEAIVEQIRQQSPRRAKGILKNSDAVVRGLVAADRRSRGGEAGFLLAFFSQWVLEGIVKAQPYFGAGIFLQASLPPRRSGFIRFRAKAGIEKYGAKGFIWSIFEPVPECRFLLIHTHLQQGNSREAVKARRAQVDQIIRFAEKRKLPIILMGDLNMEPEDPLFRALLRYLRLENALLGNGIYTYLNDNPLARHQGSFREGDPVECTHPDHVIASRGRFKVVKTKVVPAADLGNPFDHSLVQALLTFSP